MEDFNDKISYHLIKSLFELKSENEFTYYLENIYKDISIVKGNVNYGINKLKFIDFIKLPVFICEKMFVTMDKDKNGFLSIDELVDPLCKLYFGTFEETSKFIFDLYDFDQDGQIAPEDVKIMLSFLPLKTDKTKIEYKYQLESLSELDEILKITFRNHKILNYEGFLEAIKVKSDIFLQMLCYLYQRCQFKEKSVKVVSKLSSQNIKGALKLSLNNSGSLNASNAGSSNGDSESSPKSPKRLKPKKKMSAMIVLNSPSHHTRFSPVSEFLSSASIEQHYEGKEENVGDSETTETNKILSIVPKLKNFKEKSEIEEKTTTDEEEIEKKVKPKKKLDSFTDLHSAEVSGLKGMIRNPNRKSTFQKYSNKQIRVVEKIEEEDDEDKEKPSLVFESESEDCHKKVEVEVNVIMEGQLYKPRKDTESLDCIWLVLIGKDIFYYENESKAKMLKFHNIGNCFIRENGEVKIKGTSYYSFSIITNGGKARYFMVNNRAVAKEWTSKLRDAIGYKNFFQYYEMLDDLGEGQFGQVKLGVQIDTSEKVAIKIIKKAKLKENQAELLRSEIDILKVCKHPNIVKFYDHFENSEYIFIVMEYLKHGHLREYLKKRNFSITEKRIAQVANQVSDALNYLHCFGIIHRDLKPDNIMVSDTGSNFNVKLMDFGLGKIMGPNEKTVEGYGTLCFVAPEIILREPYKNSVDIWSFGIMLFYITTGEFPFDDKFNVDKEIAKKIINDKLEFPQRKWSDKNPLLKDLITKCLVKEIDKRITIEQLLKHPFLAVANESSRKGKTKDKEEI